MTGRILGMRRPVFWGAVVIVALLALVIPVRSISAQFRRKRIEAMHARHKEVSAQTPEGANSVAMGLNAEGNRFDRKRQFPAALQCYREALEVARKFNLRARAEASLEMMGNAFDDMGRADSAAIYYQKAQELAAVDSTPGRATSSLFNRGVSQIRDPKTNDSAVAMLRRALEQAQAAGDSRQILQISYNLGICYQYRDEPDSCIAILRRYVKLHRTPLSAGPEALVLHNIAAAFCQKSEWDSAYASFQKALEDYRTVKDNVNTWFVQEDIRDLGKLAGDPSSYPLPPGPAASPPYRGAESDLRHLLWYMF